jgi:hypothetical protein
MGRSDPVKVLYCHHTDPHYMPPPQLSPDQVVCGPFCADKSEAGRVISLATSPGAWSLPGLIERLPREQRPELVVVKADASRQNFPIGLDRVDARKLLVIGDTWHMYRPLSTMLAYVRQEPYDVYVTEYMRRHAHFFLEAGVPDLFWLPALSLGPFDGDFRQRRERHVSFVGQHGVHHPRRRRMIGELERRELPVAAGSAPQREALEVYASSLCTLNLSGNGDTNLRVFEALSAGGCLLTDRCRPESGLELLFRDGEHLLLWDDFDDLADKVERLLAHPSEALRIAERGRRALQRAHLPQRRRRQLIELALHGWIDPVYDTKNEPRSRVLPHRDEPAFTLAVTITECLQAMHRDMERLRVLALPRVEAALCADLVDLPRLELAMVDRGDRQRFREAGLDPRIRWLDDGLYPAEHDRPDVVLATLAELADEGVAGDLDRLAPDAIVVSDILRREERHHAEAALRYLCGRGYHVDPEGARTVFVHGRAWESLPRMRPPHHSSIGEGSDREKRREAPEVVR